MASILQDIIDPKYPLIEKFREIAPGTFKHCQNVLIICERLASELQFDLDLLKAAALYHDIGKMWNPLYFSENQDDENPHDLLDPHISYQIITKHVGDSILELMKIPGIPVELLDIIASHHGNTVLRSICNKTKNKNDDNFRYKCRRPSTPEAAILMIVDSIEATARALASTGKLENVKDKTKLVTSTIDRLGEDGQLDIVRFGVLRRTKEILIKEIDSLYHKRVQYDEDQE